MTAKNKPKTLNDIRKAIAKANNQRKLRKLSLAESKTVEKLKIMIASLKSGKNVQNRQLKTWLTATQYQDMLYNWDAQRSLRQESKEKPEPIKKYEKLLRVAIFSYNKADAFSRHGKHSTAKKLFNQTDGHFERVLEHLEEIIQIDPSLQAWFDRPISFGHKSDLGLDFDSVPRVIVSRSHFGQSTKSSVLSFQSKQDVKLQSVEAALNELLYETPEKDVSSSTKLAKLLEVMNEQDDD